mgnify:CR=1 FL=1|tara:strand:+ start:827 stop:1024 length:198 start_codon:yes stop_codon:yes gene_type:complete
MWDYTTTIDHNDNLGRYEILIERDGKATAFYVTDVLIDGIDKKQLISLLISRGIQTAEEFHAVSI